MKALGHRIRWGLAGLLACGLVVALGLLFRPLPPPPVSKPARQSPPAIKMARPTDEDRVLKDEAMIRDLRPLFLPTRFNAALPDPRREPGRTILDEEKPRREISDADLSLTRDLPPVATLNARPADKALAIDVLANGESGVGLEGIGRGPRIVEPLKARGGYIEVVRVETGRSVLADSLPVSLGPVGGKSWEPMELFAAVDAAGLAAPLLVTEGSRVDEVDAHFRKMLAQTYRIGERLPPGFYRIVVGP